MDIDEDGPMPASNSKNQSLKNATETFSEAVGPDEDPRTAQRKAMDKHEAAKEKTKMRPVSAVYNCRANLNKFCRPIGYESAVNLENTFNMEKVKKAIEKAKKAKNPPVSTKMSEQFYKCAKRKWGSDTRFQSRFVELAQKVVKINIIKCSIDFVSSTDFEMMSIVFSEIDMVNEITVFSDKCTNKDYEKMEAEFDRDLSHRRGSYRFGLNKFIQKGGD